jgi:hypothetical protein
VENNPFINHLAHQDAPSLIPFLLPQEEDSNDLFRGEFSQELSYGHKINSRVS